MCLCLTQSTPTQHLQIVQQYEPDFIPYVARARREGAAVTLMLEGYHNTREIVWSCLWYAVEQGVMVTVVPKVMNAQQAGEEQNDSEKEQNRTSVK